MFFSFMRIEKERDKKIRKVKKIRKKIEHERNYKEK